MDLGEKVCEDNWKEVTKKLNTATVQNVRLADVMDKNGDLDYRVYTPQKATGGTQKLLHMTFVFQAFVFMQVFNQINARILSGSFNVFSGICRNWMFLAVTFFTFVIQMVMVEIGGKVVKCAALDFAQNGICLAIGSGELFWGIFVKVLPTKLF